MTTPTRRLGTLLTAAALLLAGCSQADCTPPAGTPTAVASAQASKKPNYGFGLPGGDRSVDANVENAIYDELDGDHCTKAQELLDENYKYLAEPRDVILFQAGVLLCRGKTSDAQKIWNLVAQHKDRYPAGWAGVSWRTGESSGKGYSSWHVCELFRSVSSTLNRKSRDSIRCAVRKSDAQPSAYEENWLTSPDNPREAS
ncbi:hypothetical protein AB0H43_27075 [Hamadaea sp. NPDC050747]|uniref:hypothetical protein n=1 Tax=Hamadaea sp. NPDC050747 TaxID=3155789 RepID=UPI0033E2BF5F